MLRFAVSAMKDRYVSSTARRTMAVLTTYRRWKLTFLFHGMLRQVEGDGRQVMEVVTCVTVSLPSAIHAIQGTHSLLLRRDNQKLV